MDFLALGVFEGYRTRSTTVQELKDLILQDVEAIDIDNIRDVLGIRDIIS